MTPENSVLLINHPERSDFYELVGWFDSLAAAEQVVVERVGGSFDTSDPGSGLVLEEYPDLVEEAWVREAGGQTRRYQYGGERYVAVVVAPVCRR